MATGKALNGKPYAGNPHVRFDEGEVASAATPRRGSLLYKKMQLAIVGMVLLPMAAAAKTVAYWPLAYDNAQRTTLDTVFPNQGDGGTIDLKPVSITTYTTSGNTTTMTEDTTGAYCPMGTNAFPNGWCVWDPVARTNATAATGVSFKIPPDYSSSNNSRYGKQGWLRATNVSVDYSAFTVEFFYRPDPLSNWNNQSPWQALTRMLRHDNGNTYLNWSLVRVNDNTLNLYYSNTSGTSQNTGNIALTGYSNLNDEKWHHIAFSVDNSTKQMVLWFDYKKIATKTLTSVISFSANNNTLYIGGGTIGQPSGCSIAHYRISDTVLTDTDFLQFSKEKANAKIASDVLLQTSFDPFETPDELKINTDLIYGFNDAGSGSPLYRRSGYTHPDRVEDAKGKWLAWENGSERNYYCLSNLTDNTNKKFMPVLWYPEDMSYTNSSFTVECIYKSPKNIGNQWRPLVYQMGNGNNNSMSNIVFKIGYGYSYRISGMIGGYSASASMFAANDTQGTTATQNDGEWHHAALVVDRTKNRMFLYCDYNDATTNTGALPGVLCDPAAADYPVAIGSWYPSRTWPSNDDPNDTSSSSTTATSAFWGCVDAVRITKRALEPSEFIRSPDELGLIIIFK